MTPARRILHVTAVHDPHEAHGATITTITRSVPGSHHLLCAVSKGGTEGFEAVELTGTDPSGFGLRGARSLRRLVEAVDPDVVHFHGGPIGSASTARGWAGGRPVVATVLGWPRVRSAVLQAQVPLRRLARTPVLAPLTVANTLAHPSLVARALRAGGVRTVITPDPEIARRLGGHGMTVERYDGVTAPVAAVRTGACRFVFAGRAELTRGPDLLAAAVRRLRAAGHRVRVDYLLLPGPDLDRIRLAATHPDDQVIVGPTDLPQAFEGAAAVVLPFRFDHATLTPTLVAAEAMAAGLPVVASDVACLRALVEHGRDGLLVPRSDPRALATTLARFLHEPALTAELGGEAHRRSGERWRRNGLAAACRRAYETLPEEHRPWAPR